MVPLGVELLERLDRYFDRVPRDVVTATDVGPFTVFGRSQGWAYYARPRFGADRFTVADIEAVRTRQRRLGVPEEIEWIDERAPSLAGTCIAAGLQVDHHQLLVLDRLQPAPAPPGFSLQMATDIQTIAATRAAVRIGFTHGGTDPGPQGAAERDRELASGDQAAAFAAGLVAQGLLTIGCASDETGVVAGGSSQPRGDTAEIVGVATLPAARRRGLGSAVTTLIVDHALQQGIELCLLSAQDDAVAAIYARLGFRTVGTVCAASSG